MRANHIASVADIDMITDEAAKVITDVFKNRWRTLMSVDDVIGAVHGLCTDLNIIDNTYFFYSSDHGFQLGEFNIPMDKRHAYDWDTHIHLLAAGPGIKAGSTWDQPATQVQFSPLFLALDLYVSNLQHVLMYCFKAERERGGLVGVRALEMPGIAQLRTPPPA